MWLLHGLIQTCTLLWICKASGTTPRHDTGSEGILSRFLEDTLKAIKSGTFDKNAAFTSDIPHSDTSFDVSFPHEPGDVFDHSIKQTTGYYDNKKSDSLTRAGLFLPDTSGYNLSDVVGHTLPETADRHVPNSADHHKPISPSNHLPDTVSYHLPSSAGYQLPLSADHDKPASASHHFPNPASRNLPNASGYHSTDIGGHHIPVSAGNQIPDSTGHQHSTNSSEYHFSDAYKHEPLQTGSWDMNVELKLGDRKLRRFKRSHQMLRGSIIVENQNHALIHRKKKMGETKDELLRNAKVVFDQNKTQKQRPQTNMLQENTVSGASMPWGLIIKRNQQELKSSSPTSVQLSTNANLRADIGSNRTQDPNIGEGRTRSHNTAMNDVPQRFNFVIDNTHLGATIADHVGILGTFGPTFISRRRIPLSTPISTLDSQPASKPEASLISDSLRKRNGATNKGAEILLLSPKFIDDQAINENIVEENSNYTGLRKFNGNSSDAQPKQSPARGNGDVKHKNEPHNKTIKSNIAPVTTNRHKPETIMDSDIMGVVAHSTTSHPVIQRSNSLILHAKDGKLQMQFRRKLIENQQKLKSTTPVPNDFQTTQEYFETSTKSKVIHLDFAGEKEFVLYLVLTKPKSSNRHVNLDTPLSNKTFGQHKIFSTKLRNSSASSRSSVKQTSVTVVNKQNGGVAVSGPRQSGKLLEPAFAKYLPLREKNTRGQIINMTSNMMNTSIDSVSSSQGNSFSFITTSTSISENNIPTTGTIYTSVDSSSIWGTSTSTDFNPSTIVLDSYVASSQRSSKRRQDTTQGPQNKFQTKTANIPLVHLLKVYQTTTPRTAQITTTFWKRFPTTTASESLDPTTSFWKLYPVGRSAQKDKTKKFWKPFPTSSEVTTKLYKIFPATSLDESTPSAHEINIASDPNFHAASKLHTKSSNGKEKFTEDKMLHDIAQLIWSILRKNATSVDMVLDMLRENTPTTPIENTFSSIVTPNPVTTIQDPPTFLTGLNGAIPSHSDTTTLFDNTATSETSKETTHSPIIESANRRIRMKTRDTTLEKASMIQKGSSGSIPTTTMTSFGTISSTEEMEEPEVTSPFTRSVTNSWLPNTPINKFWESLLRAIR